MTSFVQGGLQKIVLDAGELAAQQGGDAVVRYLRAAGKHAEGAGHAPLQLEEAGIVDAAAQGVRALILRRLASLGEPVEGADSQPHRAKQGILERYGLLTVQHFEEILQQGFVAQTPWPDMRRRITEASPFLQQAPAHWAERIVRTEVHGALNRALWESIRESDEQLGDMVKILCATFDDRTGCLLASTRVSGAMVRAVFRRWYEGPATRLVTEAGRDFTATPNHPVLTRRGWVAAGQLRLGDELVCDGGQERSRALGDEHVAGGPAAIGEVFEALREGSVHERRRGSKQDFYGDGTDREVDVLWPNHELRVRELRPALQATSGGCSSPHPIR